MTQRLLWILLLSGAGLIFPFIAQGQSPGAVLLQSGPENFSANLDAFTQSALNPAEVIDGRYYRYVQFQRTPGNALRQRLEAQGLRLLSYVPHSTYLVSFPQNFDRRQLSAYPIHSVQPLQAQQKVAPILRDGPLPDWALHGQTIDLTVVFFPDYAGALPSEALKQLGAVLLSGLREDRTLDLRIGVNDIFTLAAQPYLFWVEPIVHPGEPEDEGGRALSRANVIGSPHPSGRHYDGSGIGVLVRDDGSVGPHIDYQGRVVQTSALGGTHGDMVASVMAGAPNLNPRAAGTAPGADLYVIDYIADFTGPTLGLHQVDSVLITNSSYSNGCNVGYTTTTRRVDEQAHLNPMLLHVFSGGNSNGNNCGYGAGSSWGNITGGHKQGKNVLAVANLNPDGSLVGSSSRGPAHDGRVKPDLAANGNGQISTEPNQTYGTSGGTSAAAPTAAGSFAQLYQAYRELHGVYPPSALIKAMMLNTAEDYGNPGPDYEYGWGRVNAYRALLTLENQQYFADTVSMGNVRQHTLQVPAGVTEVRVMVYWNDVPASANAGLALVNNLDMQVQAPNAGTHLPLILDPTPNALDLAQPAVPGVDTLNNVEQVRIATPGPGAYQLSIAGTDVPFGPQEYFVVYEYYFDEIKVTYPHGGEGLLPGELVRIQWDASGNQGSFALEYTLDDGVSWQPMGTAQGAERMFTWAVPEVVSGQARVRVTRGSAQDQSEFPFSIIPAPQNIEVFSVCTDKAQLTWNPVPGAVEYEVYLLGEKFMDSVGRSSDPFACVPISDPNAEMWFAVAAVPPQGRPGLRSTATMYDQGPKNCDGEDLAVLRLLSPRLPIRTFCFQDSLLGSFAVVNLGDAPQSNFGYGLQIDSLPPRMQTFNGSLRSCSHLELPIAEALSNLPPGRHELKIWVESPNDGNPGNDTLLVPIYISGVPYAENFESFELCTTDPDCEAISCELANGWTNQLNGLDDEIDWRVNRGGTPSTNTGPTGDFEPGDVLGQYLYLEASTCFGREGHLVTPCLDLSGTTAPLATFRYHMSGVDMGRLHIDVDAGNGWINDVIPPITGNQSVLWELKTVDLSAYAGQSVQLRFRGITGPSFNSDIALDDFQLYEPTSAPIADFSARQTTGCPADVFQFVDQSLGNPSLRIWSFSPNQVTFMSNSTPSSTHPLVTFDAPGTYQVQLLVSNANGSSRETKVGYIQVGPGSPLPLITDIEQESLCDIEATCEEAVCPLTGQGGWRNATNGIEDNIDWRVNQGGTPSFDTGPSVDHTLGTSQGQYLYLEATSCFGAEGQLVSECLDFTNITHPVLRFWYHMSGADMGSLHLDVQIDGVWNLNVMPPVVGNQGAAWQQRIVDLSAYAGQSVVLRLRGNTGADFRSDIALDDIRLDNIVPPEANFGFSAPGACTSSIITVADSTVGEELTHEWSFGSNAVPATATGPGPHQVAWTGPGQKAVRLITSNLNGVDTTFKIFTVTDSVPVADFAVTTPDSNLFEFANLSTGEVLSYAWDFGDGQTSQDTAPSHSYHSVGLYDVQLIVTNPCGDDTLTQQVRVSVASVDDLAEGLSVSIVPNPNQGSFTVQLIGEVQGEAKLTLLDAQGRSIYQEGLRLQGGEQALPIALSDLAQGVYLLRIRLGQAETYRRVVVR